MSETPLRSARQRRLAEEWALVLAAEGLASRVRQTPEGFALSVPVDAAEAASEILAAYDRENRSHQAARRRPERVPDFSPVGFAVFGLLLAFFHVTGPRNPALVWFERGSADSGRIVAGELWRAVTALTLHADLTHALANSLSGTLFLGVVCGALGPGLGAALVLLAGASEIGRAHV